MTEPFPYADANAVQGAAAALAALGLSPHYLVAPKPGIMSSGKAPILNEWQKAPRADGSTPHPLPRGNVGLRTGFVEGAPLCVVVVDLDSPEALEWGRAKLPATPLRTLTGKGEHWYYRRPVDGKVSNKTKVRLANGDRIAIDIRGDGGNVVVAPSAHPSGVIYREASPWCSADLGALPTFDSAWFDGRRKRASAEPSAPGAAGEPALAPMPSELPAERPGVMPEEFAMRLHEHLQRNGAGAEALSALRAMRDGQPYASAGARNNARFQAIRCLAEWFPDATDAQLLEWMRASLAATGDRGAEAETEGAAEVLTAARRKFAERDNLYFALAAAGVKAGSALLASDGDIRQRLIVTFPEGGHAIMRPDGAYSLAVFRPQVLYPHLAHENVLGWAERAGLAQFSYTNDDGERKRVAFPTILERHSWPVEHWRGSFNEPRSRVEGDTFIEAIAPRRDDLAPAFDPIIDQWLRMLGGTRADLLLDWLATFPRLGSPTSILVLVGAARAGKTLLADGLARLWKHGTPTPLEATVSSFNEALQRCPLLLADEKLPAMGRGRAIDEHLRALVTARTHELNRKFLPSVTVHGCVRIVVASNHARFTFEGMDQESKRALAERLLHIEASPAARDLIDELGGAPASWVQGDAIIKHVLWLAEHRAVATGTRLLVAGNGIALIDSASNSTGTNADLCQWLCSYLMRPDALQGASADYVLAGNGQLQVGVSAFANSAATWELFIAHGDRRLPSATAVGRALNSLSGDRKARRQYANRAGKQVQAVLHRIDLAQLFAWAERCGFGDLDAMRATVEREVDPKLLPPDPGALPPRRPANAPFEPLRGSVAPIAPAPAPAPGTTVYCVDDLSWSGELEPGALVFERSAPVVDLGALTFDEPAPDRSRSDSPDWNRSGSPAIDSVAQGASLIGFGAEGETLTGVKVLDPAPAPPAPPAPAPTSAPSKARKARKAPAAKVAKVKPGAPPRGPDYFTPDEVPEWWARLQTERPATPREARAWFIPVLRTAAALNQPGTFARTVAAARAYRAAVAVTNSGWDGIIAAERAWFDLEPSANTSMTPNETSNIEQ